MSQYTFPQVTGGYTWNLGQRCKYEVGIEPTSVINSGAITTLQFERELTSVEQQKLNELMSNNPTYPPSNSASVFRIQDVYEIFEQFCEQAGVELQLYYNESVPGSGNINLIEFHSSTPLNEAQRSSIKTAYTLLFID